MNLPGWIENALAHPLVVRRAILRYALQCPDAQAARFVAELRISDASYVADTEELLKAEAAAEKR